MSCIRRRTAELLEAHRPHDPLGRTIDGFLILLILANVVTIVLVTVPELGARYGNLFRTFEWCSVAIFTVEYAARLWSCVEQPLDDAVSPRRGRLDWMTSPLGIVDLLAIAPFYLMFLLPESAESLLLLRIFRGLRLLRIFKLTRYSPAMGVLFAVIRKEAPVLLVAASVLASTLILGSWGMYLLERQAQPEAFGSIPAAMWWAVVTVTTVGYGDVVPVTDAGKVFAGFLSLLGIAMMALPAAILASGFYREVHGRSKLYERAVAMALADGQLSSNESERLEVLQDELGITDEEAAGMLIEARRQRGQDRTCPHCGEPL